jgi:hypothetical protein
VPSGTGPITAPAYVFLAWQCPASRKIFPVGRLVSLGTAGYEFSYIRAVAAAQDAVLLGCPAEHAQAAIFVVNCHAPPPKCRRSPQHAPCCNANRAENGRRESCMSGGNERRPRDVEAQADGVGALANVRVWSRTFRQQF